jgi:3-oxoacyl-[acyl-carrier protein] reductase
MNQSQKIAIVTGGGRGIGRAAAITLASSGYTCVAVSRSQSEVDETARLAGNGSVGVVCDVCQTDQIQRVVDDTTARFGRIDALANCAGVAPMLPFEQISKAVWDEVIATNLTSVFLFTQAVWTPMRQQGGGVIVSVSSEASRDPLMGLSAYGAAKAGVNLLTKALAKEGDAHNIRVHAIAPTGVETAMLRKIVGEKILPTDQVLQPQDVANAIRACICGDIAYSSGETIFIHRRP